MIREEKKYRKGARVTVKLDEWDKPYKGIITSVKNGKFNVKLDNDEDFLSTKRRKSTPSQFSNKIFFRKESLELYCEFGDCDLVTDQVETILTILLFFQIIIWIICCLFGRLSQTRRLNSCLIYIYQNEAEFVI